MRILSRLAGGGLEENMNAALQAVSRGADTELSGEADRFMIAILANDLDLGGMSGGGVELMGLTQPMGLFVAGSKDFEEHGVLG